MMPEGLVKISTSLYETVLPMVHKQVSAQLKVADLSTMKCIIQPTEFSSWTQARNAIMETEKCKMRSNLEAQLSKKGSGKDTAAIRDQFEDQELEIESRACTYSNSRRAAVIQAIACPPEAATPACTQASTTRRTPSTQRCATNVRIVLVVA